MVIKNKQDLLYNSGVKLFWKHWVKRVSIDMIVQEANVAKGTFYLYYKNKEELYEHIMDDILECWTNYMQELVITVPDIKERFYLHMIGSLGFFQKNNIIKNLINGNTDYYIWKINDEYLNNKHIEFMKLLLWNEFNDEEFVEFVANTKWFFANIINHKNCFKNEIEFEKFVMNFAAVIVNWLFSDYESIKSNKTFKQITACVPQIKK